MAVTSQVAKLPVGPEEEDPKMNSVVQTKSDSRLNGQWPQNTWMQRRLVEIRIAEALGRFPDLQANENKTQPAPNTDSAL